MFRKTGRRYCEDCLMKLHFVPKKPISKIQKGTCYRCMREGIVIDEKLTKPMPKYRKFIQKLY